MYHTHAAVAAVPGNAPVALWGVYLGFSREDCLEQARAAEPNPYACFGSVAAASDYLRQLEREGSLRLNRQEI